MLFNSVEFLIFLPIVFALFWVTPARFRWIPLLIASYFFYMYWNPKLVFLILFTTAVSFVCGMLLERYADRPRAKRVILAVTLVSSLGVLLFFKYFNFLYEAFYGLVGLFGGGAAPGFFDIMLPVGISFYTFQTASYVVDVYRGSVKAERHLGYFALFVTFFPQLVAGPIERPGNLLPQLRAEQTLRSVDFVGAFRFMMVGFFKKIAVADAIGLIVNAVYNDVASANGLAALIATVLFAVQIYCDFSGYSDIAVGCAKLFGVNLTENFRTPYASRSIKEFWNRWHISLSGWLRDYVYFPLGGSRVKRARWVLNITIVFFVSGLWHGASYNFIIWGLLHAFFQIVGFFTLPYRNKFWQRVGKDPNGRLVGTLRVIGTCALATFAWIFFRASTPAQALTVIGKIFSDYGGAGYWAATRDILGLTLPLAVYTVLALCMMIFVERFKYPDASGEQRLSARGRSVLRFCGYAVMIWCVIGVWVVLQAADVGSSFIYFQF